MPVQITPNVGAGARGNFIFPNGECTQLLDKFIKLRRFDFPTPCRATADQEDPGGEQERRLQHLLESNEETRRRTKEVTVLVKAVIAKVNERERIRL